VKALRRAVSPSAARNLLVLLASLALPLHAQDATGLLRQADSAFAAEDRALAERLYRQVLGLDAEQSRAVYRLGVLTRNDEAALEWFKRYATLEPKDAWGWLAVGDKSLRVGKTVEAREAFQRAATLEPKEKEVQERLARGRLRAAPTLEPVGGYARDSDGNGTWTYGLNGDVALRGGWRVGGRVIRSAIGDGSGDATLDQGLLRLEGRPRMAWRVDLSGGPARLAAPGTDAWLTGVADLRIRWHRQATAVEIRAQRLALGTTPQLVANRAMRNEAKLSVELPAGPLRLRAAGRAGLIEALGEDPNRRLQGDAALVLPLGWRGEISAQYHRLGYAQASTAGYFAPERVETIEAGSYWELGGDGAVSFSVDLGAGGQRVADQGAEVGPWRLALRGWALLAVDLSRTIQWRTEAEAYSAPFAPVGVATASDWRYGSVTTGLLVRVP